MPRMSYMASKYIMFFGRNEALKMGLRIEYTGQITGNGITGWTTPVVVLRPGGTGENELVHDLSCYRQQRYMAYVLYRHI
jgi:hypothetical protein